MLETIANSYLFNCPTQMHVLMKIYSRRPI